MYTPIFSSSDKMKSGCVPTYTFNASCHNISGQPGADMENIIFLPHNSELSIWNFTPKHISPKKITLKTKMFKFIFGNVLSKN